MVHASPLSQHNEKHPESFPVGYTGHARSLRTPNRLRSVLITSNRITLMFYDIIEKLKNFYKNKFLSEKVL